MTITRRTALRLATAMLALPGTTRFGHAQSYPTRPVHWIVPFPAGGPSDIVARLIGQKLSSRLGHPFVIENRVGANGNIGTQAVVQAVPDGHTLLFAAAPNAINAALYDNLGFNFVRDIAPVASIARGALVMLVAPSFAETVPGYEASTWFGAGAPKATPPEVIAKLNKALNTVLVDQVMSANLASLGASVFTGSPADFAAFLADETKKWANVVKRAGIKPE